MAEASSPQHWRSRRVPQVIWIINEIYNKLWDAVTINSGRILKLGDELDKEDLLHLPSPSSWQSVKGATRVDKKELLQLLKDYSEKTFSTRVIFMKWMQSRDKLEYEFFRKKEIDHVLETLNKSERYCDRDKLYTRGIVVHQESSTNMFETLAVGFGESSGILMAEKIMEELKTNIESLKYKEHDHNKWIPVVLKKRAYIPWDPLVFCVCANIYDCVVSIQANDSVEYRIYPETVYFKSMIKFAHVESSKYVYLKCIKEVFDCVFMSGFYTSDDERMRKTMKRQLAEMQQDQDTKKKNNQNEDIVDAHSRCFEEMIRKKKILQKDVKSLEFSLEQAKIEEEETRQSYDQMSQMFDELVIRKSKLDQKVKQKRQQRDLSEERRYESSNKQKEMNHAQVCSNSSVRVRSQRKQNSKKDNEFPTVSI